MIALINLVVLNFTMMRIQVDKDLLRWHFGVGFPYKTMAISDIESVEQVRNNWWNGWGIRKLISGGWLYNVYGLDAVEVKTRQGKIVRLGTDEPKQLKRVLLNVVEKNQGADHG